MGPWGFARAEGEGFTSIDDWRAGHERFWQSTGITVSASTEIVCVRFHLVQR